MCDNVDLKIILEEYSSYHQVKYGKRPDICRRAEKEVGMEGCLQGNPARRRKAQRALNKMKRWPLLCFWFRILNWNRGGVFSVEWFYQVSELEQQQPTSGREQRRASGLFRKKWQKKFSPRPSSPSPLSTIAVTFCQSGNSIVYRNHKVCDGLASLYDGVPSYIVLLKWLQSIISQIESFHMMESHHMMEFHHMMTFHHIMNKRCACSSSGLPASEGPDRRV